MSNRFDFSKIDEALPGAEKMQREERLANTLEDNYKAVHALCDMVEKLENRLLEALSEMDGAVSSLRQASKVTVSEETGRVLEREGDKICRKIAGRLEDESARLFEGIYYLYELAYHLIDFAFIGNNHFLHVVLVHDRGDSFSFGCFVRYLCRQCAVHT